MLNLGVTGGLRSRLTRERSWNEERQLRSSRTIRSSRRTRRRDTPNLLATCSTVGIGPVSTVRRVCPMAVRVPARGQKRQCPLTDTVLGRFANLKHGARQAPSQDQSVIISL